MNMAADREYKRLARSSIVRMTSLWLGKDHILCVERSGYTEDYRRFYFRDIQGLIVCKSNLGMAFNFVLGFLMALLTAIGWFANDPVALGIFGTIAGSLGLLLVVNLVLGPTCDCHIKTAVQVERLSGLKRLRKARKVIRILKPLIEGMQGTLTAEEVPTKYELTSSAPPVMKGKPMPAILPSLKVSNGKIHRVLFCILLSDLPVTAGDIFAPHPLWNALAGVYLLALFGMLITALVHQHGSNLPGRIRTLTWIILGCNIAFFIGAMIYGVVAGIQGKFGGLDGSSKYSDPVILTMTIVTTASSVIFGVLGLAWIGRFGQESKAALPPALITTTPAPASSTVTGTPLKETSVTDSFPSDSVSSATSVASEPESPPATSPKDIPPSQTQ